MEGSEVWKCGANKHKVKDSVFQSSFQKRGEGRENWKTAVIILWRGGIVLYSLGEHECNLLATGEEGKVDRTVQEKERKQRVENST